MTRPSPDFGLISIVMPCFNAEHYVETAVECVVEQSYPSVELIIVDDGSTDRSCAILAELARRHGSRITLIQQANQGPYPARNLALSRAKGEFVAFLDADDYWTPDCLSKLHASLIAGDADLVYCGWQNVVENGTDGEPYVPPIYEAEDVIARFLKGCPWPIHAALTRRSVVAAVNGFSTRYFSSMDYDLWLRIAAITRKIVQVPEVLAFYRWHDKGQISSIKWRQVLDSWQVRKDFVHANPALIRHIDRRKLRELSDGYLAAQAYAAFWKRDLNSAQKLFRVLLKTGFWHLRELKYLLPSVLPAGLYRTLISRIDR
jgi:glycosyltransferase involved in cell wall biosynthesis